MISHFLSQCTFMGNGLIPVISIWAAMTILNVCMNLRHVNTCTHLSNIYCLV